MNENVAISHRDRESPAQSYEDRLKRGQREAAEREAARLAALDASHGAIWRAAGW